MNSLATCLLAATLAQAPQAGLSRGYRGPEGQKVEVVSLLPLAEHRALVRVTGAGSPADGLVLFTTVNETSRGARAHVTRVRGADWEVLRLDEGRGEAFLPDVQPFTVKFDATIEIAAPAVIEAHLAQRERGDLALLAKKPYPAMVKKYEAAAAAALAKTCGGTLAFSFAWATFPDEFMAEIDAWAACAPLVTKVGAKCGALKGVTQLVCQAGAQHALARSGSTLTFTTTPKGASTGPSFVQKHLE